MITDPKQYKINSQKWWAPAPMIRRSKLHLSFYSIFLWNGNNFFSQSSQSRWEPSIWLYIRQIHSGQKHKFFITSISKKHELDISAEDTNNNQLVELRYRWANVWCYFTDLETGPEVNLELQHPNFSLDIEVPSVTCNNYWVSIALHTWKCSIYWGAEGTLRNISSSKHALKY